MADKVGIKVVVDTKSGAVNVDKLENSFEKLDTEIKQTNSRLKKFGSSLFSFKGALAGLGIGLATKKLADMSLAQFELQDETIKSSRAIGIQVESLISLRRSAELGGASVQSLDNGMKRLSRNIYDTAEGTGEAQKAFDEMGISVVDNNGNLKTTEEILLQVADNFAKMEDGTKKNAQAQLLFGRSGGELINTLNQGSQAIIKQREEAEKLGIVFDEQTGKNAEELNDALGDLGRSFQGAFQQVTNELAPRLTPLIKDLTDAIVNNKDDIKEWGKGLFDAFNLALPVIQAVGTEIRNTLNWWSSFFQRASNVNRMQEVTELADRYLFIKQQLKEMTPLAEKFKKAGIDNAVVSQVEAYKNELSELQVKLDQLRAEASKSPEESKEVNENRQIKEVISFDNSNFRASEEEAEIESLKRITESQREFALKQWGIKKEFEKRQEQLNKQRTDAEIRNSMAVADASITLLREVFGENKLFSSLDIGLSTARGIMSALAMTPPNVPLAGIIGATGAVQLAKVNGLKFANGTEYVTGNGTNRSDSVPAMLSVGERVVDSATNAQLGGISNDQLLEAVRGGGGVNVTVNAGIGSDAESIAQAVVNAIQIAKNRGLEPQLV